MPEEESGMDELLRLSRQFTRQQEENDRQERQRREQGQKVQGVLRGLKNLNINMALEQLKSVAPAETVKRVTALKKQPGTDDLRKMISSLIDDLETKVNSPANKDAAAGDLVNQVRALNILMDLYFSLQ